eukprot:scaffold211270_cov35-Attheya_sp.AAC.1
MGAREDLLADLDMRELLAGYASLRPGCCCHGRGWVGVGFVDISLVEAPAVKRGGCGACGKGRNGGKWDETVFWGDSTIPVVVFGAAGWRKRVD